MGNYKIYFKNPCEGDSLSEFIFFVSKHYLNVVSNKTFLLHVSSKRSYKIPSCSKLTIEPLKQGVKYV